MFARIREIASHAGLRRYGSNGAWVFLEQLVRGIVGILVGIYVARYLGPESFGVLAYVLSIVALAAAASRLGVDAVLVRNIVGGGRSPATDLALELGTGFWLMLAGGAVALTGIVGLEWFFATDTSRITYMLLAGGTLICQAGCVVDLYFQAQVRSRPVVIARMSVLLGASVLKIAAVDQGYTLLAFFVITFVEQLATLLLYAVIAWSTPGLPGFLFRFSGTRATDVLKSAWPLMLTAVAVTLYMRLDQVMLSVLLDDVAVGVYAAAARFYEAWVMLPYLAAASLTPALVRARARGEEVFRGRMTALISGLFWSSLAVGVLVAVFARPLILATFGTQYEESAAVLSILMLGSPWAALGTATVRYLLVERMERRIASRTAIAAIVNLLLNLALIPGLGVMGAAISNLVAMLLANFAIDWLDPRLANLRRLKLRAIFHLPFSKRAARRHD